MHAPTPPLNPPVLGAARNKDICQKLSRVAIGRGGGELFFFGKIAFENVKQTIIEITMPLIADDMPLAHLVSDLLKALQIYPEHFIGK